MNETNGASILIERFRGGEEEAFSELLKQYQPLIDSLVFRFGAEESGALGRDDLRQEAVLAFYHSVQAFDLEQNEVEFGLYAKICISNALVSKLRMKRSYVEESLDEALLLPSDDRSEDPVARILEEEREKALYAVIRANLSKFEYRVWRLYLSGRTAREIGELVGKDEKSISNAVYRIRKKLRAALQ